MDLSLEQWGIIFQILQAVLTLGVMVYVWVTRRSQVNSSRIDQLEKDINHKIDTALKDIDEHLDNHSERLVRAEETIKRMPSTKENGKVHKRIDDLSEGFNHLSGEFKQVNNTLRLIHQYLLDQGGKKE